MYNWLINLLGSILNLGTALSPALNDSIKALIPMVQQADVNARMRRCKWILLHNKNIIAADLIKARFLAFKLTDDQLKTLTDLLIEEVKK